MKLKKSIKRIPGGSFLPSFSSEELAAVAEWGASLAVLAVFVFRRFAQASGLALA